MSTPTWLAIKRRQKAQAIANKKIVAAKVVAAPKVERSELQAQAKELDIPANQSNEKLAKAIEKKAKAD